MKIENKALREAYGLLHNRTPLGAYNCGKLCEAACCKGNADCGMWMFPHEEEIFVKSDNFTIKQTKGNFGYPMIVCNGDCERYERPLSCRIFPLFPAIIEENGEEKIRILRDPRASMCPLILDKSRLDQAFVRNVKLAGAFLAQDEEIKEYMKKVAAELLEIAELKKLLSAED